MTTPSNPNPTKPIDLTLSENQIWDIARGNKIQLAGIFSKDKLPAKGTCQGKYVINLQSSTDGNGTHWVALHMPDKTHGKYFDSFGLPPPEEVLAICPDCEHNKTRYQALKSDACGWFCIYFLKPLPLQYFHENPELLWKNDAMVTHALKYK